MTTVITRLYSDEQSAIGVRERLYRNGFPRHMLSVVTPRDGDAIRKNVERALVPSEVAESYAAQISGGACLVVARCTYKPLNAVRVATQTFDSSGAIASGLEDRFKVPTPRDHAPSVLKDHPRFLTMAPRPGHSRGPVSQQFGLSLLSARKRRHSVNAGNRIFGEGISRKARKSSVKPGGGHMSKAFWPMALVSSNPRSLSVIPGGGQPFSRLLGWPTIS